MARRDDARFYLALHLRGFFLGKGVAMMRICVIVKSQSQQA